MLHSTDSTKNFNEAPSSGDFGEKYSFGLIRPEFYRQDKLLEDGFIFPDGSLRFEFFIKKTNFMQRLQIANTTNTDLKAENEKFKAENEKFKAENEKSKAENEKLKAENAQLKQEKRTKEIETLKQDLKIDKTEVTDSQSEN